METSADALVAPGVTLGVMAGRAGTAGPPARAPGVATAVRAASAGTARPATARTDLLASLGRRNAEPQITDMEPASAYCVISDFKMPKINGLELLKAIRCGDAKVARLPSEAVLASRVEELRKTIGIGPSRMLLAKLISQSEELYQNLILPAEAVIRGKRRLIFIPDGALHYLSFGAFEDDLPRIRMT